MSYAAYAAAVDTTATPFRLYSQSSFGSVPDLEPVLLRSASSSSSRRPIRPRLVAVTAALALAALVLLAQSSGGSPALWNSYPQAPAVSGSSIGCGQSLVAGRLCGGATAAAIVHGNSWAAAEEHITIWPHTTDSSPEAVAVAAAAAQDASMPALAAVLRSRAAMPGRRLHRKELMRLAA